MDHPPLVSGISDRYEVLRKLGEGAAGEVFQARDRSLDRPVALKVLKADAADSEHVARFHRELQLLLDAPHPAVLPVLDAQLEGAHPYLVLQWMGGGDLTRRIAQGPCPPAEVAATGERLAEALQHLHEHGVLHRDLKPENILLDERGEAYISDLGLGSDDSEGADRLTATGVVVGTPRYMALELLREGRYGASTDVFALAAVLLELLAGQRLRGLATDPSSLQEVVGAAPPIPLRTLLVRRLGAEEAPRASAAGLAEELARLRERPSSGTSPRGEEAAPSTGEYPVTPAPAKRGGRALLPAALVFTCLALGVLLAPGEPSAPATAAALPRPTSSPSPFGTELREELQRELDRALARRYTASGQPAPGGPLDFRRALLACGVALLDRLPVQRRVLEWFASGRPPEELPSDTRATLENYDASFRDLLLPPPFEAFLGASPRATPPRPARVAHLAQTAQELLALPARGASARAGWLRACQEHLGRALDAREELEHRIVTGSFVISGTHRLGSALMATTSRLSFDAAIHQARQSPAGRLLLQEHLAQGLSAVRAYLVAGARALRAPGPPSEGAPLALTLADALKSVDGFLAGTYASAGPRRLYPGEAQDPAEALFQATTLGLLRTQQLNTDVPASSLDLTADTFLRRALAVCLEGDDPAASARVYLELLDAYRDLRSFDALLHAVEELEDRVDLSLLTPEHARLRDQLVSMAQRALGGAQGP